VDSIKDIGQAFNELMCLDGFLHLKPIETPSRKEYSNIKVDI
jgi:hypothetical protein